MVEENQGVTRSSAGRATQASPEAPAGLRHSVSVPNAAPGHWDTPSGREIAEEYAGRNREDLCLGHLSDLALANAVYLAMRSDLDLISYQTAAKERIRWLSVRLLIAETALAAAQGIDARERQDAAGGLIGEADESPVREANAPTTNRGQS